MSTSDAINRLIAVCASQIGYFRRPGTRTLFGEWYGLPTGQWCAMFLSWASDQAGTRSVTPHHAYTPSGVNWFKARGQWHSGRSGIRRGDWVYFDFPGAPNRVSHVAIVESVNSDGSINTIEGNTSGPGGDQRNGGCCLRKRRASSIVGYGRPNYASAPPAADNHPRNADGSLTIAQDGIEGPQTISRWQEVMGTPIDGFISPTSTLIRADQTFLNSVVGSAHIRNLTGSLRLEVDGIRGRKTDIVRQFWLRNAVNPGHQNNLIGKGLDFDGIWGPQSTLVMQFALNNATAGSKQYGRV